MDLTFASRPKTSAGKYTTYNYSDITWGSSARAASSSTSTFGSRIRNLLAAGTESSASMVEWAMSELIKAPRVIKKARED
ncbi:hypothetical protein SASPL_139394 [Salvia splendens]|uniref:Uncharacterized protein n=1 Tax=Salvia splendens TaxID=180675 RepID=A0A8X8WPZ9_SALSN|nr:hypothetical protein SASPL_139394 [Salvia splendens]